LCYGNALSSQGTLGRLDEASLGVFDSGHVTSDVLDRMPSYMFSLAGG
jgi:hypothetical protein